MDIALTVFKFFVIGVAIIAVLVATLYLAVYLINRYRNRMMLKTDKALKKYYSDIDYTSEFSVIDETPQSVAIGKRVFLLRPLKYSQFIHLLSVFGKAFDKLKDADISNTESLVSDIMDTCENEVLRALAYIIHYGEKRDYDVLTLDGHYNFIKENITMNQLARIIDVLLMQNDVKRFMANFDRFSKKKRVNKSGNSEYGKKQYLLFDIFTVIYEKYGWTQRDILDLTVMQLNMYIEILTEKQIEENERIKQQNKPKGITNGRY